MGSTFRRNKPNSLTEFEPSVSQHDAKDWKTIDKGEKKVAARHCKHKIIAHDRGFTDTVLKVI